MRGSRSNELARLKKKKKERKKEKHLARFVSSWFGTFAMLSRASGSLVGHEDEWYVVIKAYKLAVFEILGDFFVLPYIACPRYPYIRVYRLYDTCDQVDHKDLKSPCKL